MRVAATTIAGALLLAACEGRSPVDSEEPAGAEGLTLRVDQPAATVLLGHAVKLTGIITDSNGSVVTRLLRWTTRRTDMFRLSSDGFVTGLLPGDDWVFVSDGARLLDSSRISVRVRFARIYAGTDLTCGLDDSSRAICWGSNLFGSVGNGAADDALTPVPVMASQSFGALAVGGGSACGFSAAGPMHCWGYNAVGQLGDGTTRPRPTPIRIADSLSLGRVVLGTGVTSCARDGENRTLCWGWNGFGQLLDSTRFNWRSPRALPVQFAALTTGGGHLCGLDDNGAAWCWGRNDYGQLGDGTAINRDAPTLVAGGHVFVEVAAGREHTCGRSAPGTVYCWGRNESLQLGTAGVDAVASPRAVDAPVAFDTVVTSGNHTCALAAGEAWCWGTNATGQLGRGRLGSAGAVARVNGDLRFKAISAGVTHTCAVSTDAIAYCWGRNVMGAIGNGWRVDVYVPERVAYQP